MTEFHGDLYPPEQKHGWGMSGRVFGVLAMEFCGSIRHFTSFSLQSHLGGIFEALKAYSILTRMQYWITSDFGKSFKSVEDLSFTSPSYIKPVHGPAEKEGALCRESLEAHSQ